MLKKIKVEGNLKPLNDNDVFPGGKRFDGVKMEKVPAWYFVWVVDRDWVDPRVVEYYKKNEDIILSELEER